MRDFGCCDFELIIPPLCYAARSQVASKRLTFSFLRVICTVGETGFEVHEECIRVLVGSSVTVEYSHFRRKKWRKYEIRVKENPKKYAENSVGPRRSNLHSLHQMETPGETSEMKSPKDPKKGETQRKRAELNRCVN